jgi:hypothetical protein
MEKRATDKQINYLKGILRERNLRLQDLLQKEYDQLTYDDICSLFKRCDVPFSIDMRNLEYIIQRETDDYIIGEQFNRKTSNKIMDIIAFKNLMVLDYDIKDCKITKSDLLKYITDRLSVKPYSFSIYETFGGYHVYCTSNRFDYSHHSTHSLMKDFGCDQFYIGFTKYVGFAVRLNRKPNRNEVFIERFVTRINESLVDNSLEKLVQFKDNLILTINV